MSKLPIQTRNENFLDEIKIKLFAFWKPIKEFFEKLFDKGVSIPKMTAEQIAEKYPDLDPKFISEDAPDFIPF